MTNQKTFFSILDSYQIPSIPYMGNKRKLATRIINSITNTIGYDFQHFYDLFGGGGSMSMATLRLDGVTVHYNELNTAIVNLMKHIQNGGEIPYKWVTRDEFFECLKGDTWWDGLVQSCWSFGNKQDSYLYGRDIEGVKYLGHRICVDKDGDAMFELEKLLGFGLNIDFDQHPQKIRLQLKSEIEQRKGEIRLQHLERLNFIEHLQRLQHLQHLQRLQHLQLTNLSYDEVEIVPKSVIYCDPPYSGTGECKEGGFDHDKFYAWCIENPHPVFISEYKMPKEFELVASFEHRSTLSSTKNDKKTIENLYWNGK